MTIVSRQFISSIAIPQSRIEVRNTEDYALIQFIINELDGLYPNAFAYEWTYDAPRNDRVQLMQPYRHIWCTGYLMARHFYDKWQKAQYRNKIWDYHDAFSMSYKIQPGEHRLWITADARKISLNLLTEIVERILKADQILKDDEKHYAR